MATRLIPKFLARATGRMELPLTEMGGALQEDSFGESR